MKNLQNGSDIRGISIDTKNYKANLTKEVSEKIATGFIKFLKKNYNKEDLKISVGVDSRLSANSLKNSFINSLAKNKANVIDCGLSTTPAMFMSTVWDNYDCDGAVMITASHLPYFYNGFKFFTKDGGLENEDIEYIINNADAPLHFDGKVINKNLLDDYLNYLANFIKVNINSEKNYEKPLEGFHIIVDAGNGSGGFYANMLGSLGAKTEGSQFLDPDGNFPNHVPNPEDKDAMKSISDAVKRNHADLGIIFDTDVDRAALVSANGKEINRNSLIALISSIILKENKNSTIVTDSVTSDGLTDFINDLGGVHHRYMRGYRNVINEAIRLNKEGTHSPLAMETSGHGALMENYFLDDGAYLISKILITAAKLKFEGKNLDYLIKNLKHPLSEKNFRIIIEKKDYKAFGKSFLEDLTIFTKNTKGLSLAPKNYEGVKVLCDEKNGDGWFLARLSLHEPLLVINLESNTVDGVSIMEKTLLDFLLKYKELKL